MIPLLFVLSKAFNSGPSVVVHEAEYYYFTSCWGMYLETKQKLSLTEKRMAKLNHYDTLVSRSRGMHVVDDTERVGWRHANINCLSGTHYLEGSV